MGALAFAFAAILLTLGSRAQQLPQTVSVQQCRCADIDECSAKIATRTEECKVDARCIAFLKPAGDEAKIRACLEAEQAEVRRLEECVRARVGTVGCSTDPRPGNLTVPLIPVVEVGGAHGADEEAAEATLHPSPPNGPPELGQYLMCVEQCAMTEERRRFKRNPVTCAFKLRCALAPPDESVQRAFLDCQKQLGVDPQKRLRESCQCLRGAGLAAMQC